jgi:hypothetical protein
MSGDNATAGISFIIELGYLGTRGVKYQSTNVLVVGNQPETFESLSLNHLSLRV